MTQLPDDVVRYLLEHPQEVKKIQDTIVAIEEDAAWRAQVAEARKNAKTVECGTYGCTMPRNEMDIMCKSCFQDYREDPDAFK